MNLKLTLLILLFMVSACDQPVEIKPSGRIVKIGFIGNLKGFEPLGIHSLQGAQVVQKEQPLLKNGDKIQLIPKEQGKNINDIKLALTELADKDKVSAILISSKSKIILQIRDFADSLKLPIIALTANHPDITLNTNYIVQLGFNNQVQATVAALFVRDELLIEKVAIFIETSDPYSSYLGKEFTQRFKHTNGLVTGSYTLSDINKKNLQQLKEQGTEMLYLPLNAQPALNIIDLLSEINWSPKLMGSNGLIDLVLSEFPDRITDLNGMYSTELLSDSDEYARISSWGLKLTVIFESMFERSSVFTILGAEGYALAVNAMNHCSQPTNRQCINNRLRLTKNFEGFMTRLSIDDTGKTERPIFISKIEDGMLLPLVKVY